MTIKTNFPNYLENLTQAKFGSFLYSDEKSGCIIEVGVWTKIFEEIKGLFGYVNKTSSQVLATRLTQIIKQNKKQIDVQRLDVLMKVAKRADAFNHLAQKFSKLQQKVTQLAFKPLEKSVSSKNSLSVESPPSTSLSSKVSDKEIKISELVSKDADSVSVIQKSLSDQPEVSLQFDETEEKFENLIDEPAQEMEDSTLKNEQASSQVEESFEELDENAEDEQLSSASEKDSLPKSLKQHYQDILDAEKEEELNNSKAEIVVQELDDLPIPEDINSSSDSQQMTAWKVGTYVLGALVLAGSSLWLYSRQSKDPIEKEFPPVEPWVDAARWGQKGNPEDVMCAPLAAWVDAARWPQNPQDSMCFPIVKNLSEREQAQEQYIQFAQHLNPQDAKEAKKILAGGDSFDDEQYRANGEKYLKKLKKERFFLVHPDKCSTKTCEDVYSKVEEATESLMALSKPKSPSQAKSTSDYWSNLFKPRPGDPNFFSSFLYPQNLKVPRGNQQNTQENPKKNFVDALKQEQAKSKSLEAQYQLEIDQMDRGQLNEYIKKLDVKETAPELLHVLFVLPTHKENHQQLSREQIGDLLPKVSQSKYFDLFEKEQWVSYTKDLNFSDLDLMNDSIFRVLAEKKYLSHLSDVQLKAIVKRFGVYFRNREGSQLNLFENLEKTQLQRFISNFDDVKFLIQREPFYHEVMDKYAHWLSDRMVTSLMNEKGLGHIYHKFTREQFDRYIQTMSASELSAKKMEIQVYYKSKYQELPVFPEPKVSTNQRVGLEFENLEKPTVQEGWTLPTFPEISRQASLRVAQLKARYPDQFAKMTKIESGDFVVADSLEKKVPEWSYETSTGRVFPVDPHTIEQVVDWAVDPLRKRFDFEYTSEGWQATSKNNFDFQTIDKTAEILRNHSVTKIVEGAEGGFETLSYVNFSFKENVEKALLSIIDGNIVLWQRTSEGKEFIIVESLSEDLSAFNLFEELPLAIQDQGRLILPLRVIKLMKVKKRKL